VQAGWGDRGRESVLGKSLMPWWRWEFAPKLGEAALEPQSVLNPNWDPTGNAPGGLPSLGTGSGFDMGLSTAWAVPFHGFQQNRKILDSSANLETLFYN